MEKDTGFGLMLTNCEMKNIYNYLKTTINWLCRNFCYKKEEERGNYCLIHEIKERFNKIYQSKVLSNFEKRIFIKRMFRALEADDKKNHKLPYCLAIFKDMKNISNH